MSKPRYLSITISATCDNCGRETNDAENTHWRRINETVLCPECVRVWDKIGFALANVLEASQENLNPEIQGCLGAASRSLQRAQRKMVH